MVFFLAILLLFHLRLISVIPNYFWPFSVFQIISPQAIFYYCIFWGYFMLFLAIFGYYKLVFGILSYFILGYFWLCEAIVSYFWLLKVISPYVILVNF